MRNIFYKIKSSALAVGGLLLIGSVYYGIKVYKHLQDWGDEPEPLTDEDIRNTLGI